MELPKTAFDCHVAMNCLAWVHRAWERPFDPRKFTQIIAVAWWMYNTEYSGDCAGDPNEQRFTCDSCGKRKRVATRESVRDD